MYTSGCRHGATATQVNRYARLIGVYSLMFSALACQPVIAIGWKEILFVAILAVLLIGPPLYRLIRKFEKSQRQKEK